MKQTQLMIKHTKHFWERVEQRNIDLSAILDVYTKASSAKIGDTIIGKNQNSSIVAKRTSACKVVLVTAYKN